MGERGVSGVPTGHMLTGIPTLGDQAPELKFLASHQGAGLDSGQRSSCLHSGSLTQFSSKCWSSSSEGAAGAQMTVRQQLGFLIGSKAVPSNPEKVEPRTSGSQNEFSASLKHIKSDLHTFQHVLQHGHRPLSRWGSQVGNATSQRRI